MSKLYSEYMKSERWRRVRARRIFKDRGMCFVFWFFWFPRWRVGTRKGMMKNHKLAKAFGSISGSNQFG